MIANHALAEKGQFESMSPYFAYGELAYRGMLGELLCITPGLIDTNTTSAQAVNVQASCIEVADLGNEFDESSPKNQLERTLGSRAPLVTIELELGMGINGLLVDGLEPEELEILDRWHFTAEGLYTTTPIVVSSYSFANSQTRVHEARTHVMTPSAIRRVQPVPWRRHISEASFARARALRQSMGLPLLELASAE